MKLKINDPKSLVKPDKMEPIVKRLQQLLGRLSVQNVSFDVHRLVKSGKAGVSLGPLRDNDSIPMSIQCGKGGMRVRGGLSSPIAHVAQLFQELAGVSDHRLKIVAGPKRSGRKGNNGSKATSATIVKKAASESGPTTVIRFPSKGMALKPGEMRVVPASRLSATERSNLASIPPGGPRSDLEKKVWKLEAAESHTAQLQGENECFRKDITKIEGDIAKNDKLIKEEAPMIAKLKRLRKELGAEED
jgi:hypothetical protein